MDASAETGRELARLEGGPAHGMRVWVAAGSPVLQVAYPCEVEGAPVRVRADALYIYRIAPRAKGAPLRYGFDGASP
ncbi:hypothetical protein AB0F42_06700 [Streptomyces buecherae]|uniref:hypothetical protein n=1 Tax=Streptomyces buecherae TaxID=2763006 RepID=UPI0033CAD7AE